MYLCVCVFCDVTVFLINRRDTQFDPTRYNYAGVRLSISPFVRALSAVQGIN